jgi:hypothetical protein
MKTKFEQRLEELPAEVQELFLQKLRGDSLEEAYDVLSRAGFGPGFTLAELAAYRMLLDARATASRVNLADIPAALNGSESVRRHRPRRSKIAHLPAPVLEDLNQRLERGDTYKSIVQWLATLGHPGISLGNLSKWRWSGYQDWVADSESKQQAAALKQWALARVRDQRPDELHQAVASFLAARLFGAMRSIDTCLLREQLQAHPENFIHYVDRLIRATRLSIAGQRNFARDLKALFPSSDKTDSGQKCSTDESKHSNSISEAL